VQERIQTSEYQVTWQDRTVLPGLDRAWHAPNRSHDLRTYFTDDGIRVVRRTEREPSWELGLSLIGYGRGETVSPVGKAALSPYENRIDYDRAEIVEWYVNDGRGLEQGFTLAGPPEALATWGDAGQLVVGDRHLVPGANDNEEDAPAFLVLALDGSLSPVISEGGQAIDFAAPGGSRVLHYAQLHVSDARGRELPAWLEGFAEAGVRGIRIVFDDSQAAYPVTVDPLLTSPAWTAEGDQVLAELGTSLSSAGDVNGDGYSDVIVGARGYDNGHSNEGGAFVYHGSASGLSPTAAWTAEGDQANANLGWSASTAGDVNGDGYADVIVGAHGFENSEFAEGRAFVYHGSAAGLSAVPDWTAEGDHDGAEFGYSVSEAGDVNGDGYADIIVGAVSYDDAGRSYVYHGSTRGLSTAPDWITEGGQPGAGFGISVSTAGDVNGDGFADVVVGASNYDNGDLNEGRACVYHGSPAGLTTTADWTAEGNQDHALFGTSVSTAGDVNGDGFADVVVGANQHDNGELSEGRAYVYHGSVVGLSATASWINESDQPGASFGTSVSTAGDVNGDGFADVVVGAPGYDNVEAAEGRAYVYHGSAAGLSATAGWTAESNQAGAWFGDSVSTAGDVNGDGYADVIVSAPRYENGEAYEGQAYVYHGSATGLSISAGWTAEGGQTDARFGCSVSSAGDVNGDGYSDIIIGAILYDNGHSDEGKAFVYHGSAGGPSISPTWTAEGNQTDAWFGWSVSSAGDVNGDGYSDVIIGAKHYENGEAGEGGAFAFHGSAIGLLAVPAWTAEGNQSDAFFGEALSTAGDVNGDGYADVIVGAHYYDNGETEEGRAYVYHGSPNGLTTTAAWTAESDQADAWFGQDVSTAGDVNGDGYADVIIGAPLYDNAPSEWGRAAVYHGSPTGLSTVPNWTAANDYVGAWFGYSVSTAGDVNGDGYADVIVGADHDENDQTDEGMVYVYHGSPAGLNATADWTAEGNQSSSLFGYSVSTAGDVNGDGYADVIVGSPHHANPEEFEGGASVYLGSSSGLQGTADWVAEGNQSFAGFGGDVATAGDVNGDGYADVIIGADAFENGDAKEGQALVYYGDGGPGVALRPQQRRADDLAPIVDGGRSRESGSFRLGTLGRSPFGRGRVRLESEVKPLGRPFDGADTQQGPWLDSDIAGAVFNELITDLEPGPYHWRLRLHYDPVTTPLQSASRWFTVPWNGWQERDLTVSPFLGGQVWEDRDGDGVMQPEEPRLAGVVVHLVAAPAQIVQTTVTGGDGSYRLDVGSGGLLKVQFEVPTGWTFTLPDQGVDDYLDSDADTVSGETALMAPPFDSTDEERWSAGLRRVGICSPPDEPVYIYNVSLTAGSNAYTVLHFQDPNQLGAVTGYDVYRSSDAGLPHEQWPLVAYDAPDMDEFEPNRQWIDTSGDVSPSGVWYYQIAPYNHVCPAQTAEGPW
jgi:hypothetical protein